MTGRHTQPPNPRLIAMREQVAERLAQWVKASGMTYRDVGQLMGLGQTDIVFIVQGDTSNLRLERLLNAWTKIGGTCELQLALDNKR